MVILLSPFYFFIKIVIMVKIYVQVDIFMFFIGCGWRFSPQKVFFN